MAFTPQRININSLRFTPISPAAWISDSSVDVCYICNRLFTLFNRKHHCRNCGNVICSTCSDYRLPIVYDTTNIYSDDEYQRVCMTCYQLIITQAKYSSNRNISINRHQSVGSADLPNIDIHKTSKHTNQQSNNNENQTTTTNNHNTSESIQQYNYITPAIDEWKHIQAVMLVYCTVISILCTTTLHYQYSYITYTILLLYSVVLCQSILLMMLLLPIHTRNELLNIVFDVLQSLRHIKHLESATIESTPTAIPTTTAPSTDDAQSTEIIQSTDEYILPPLRHIRGYRPVNSTVAQQLIVKAGNTVDTVWTMCTNDTTWIHRKTKNNVQLYNKLHNNRTIFKAELLIDNLTPNELFTYLHDNNNDTQWNDNLHEMIQLQSLDSTTEICYVCTKTVAGVVSGRDFMTVATYKQINNSYIICSQSIQDTDYVNTNNAVRGINGPSGFVQLSTDNPNTVQLIAIFDCQLMGWMSQSLVDSLADDVLIQLLNKIKSSVLTHYNKPIDNTV